jgi:hypothetical protein
MDPARIRFVLRGAEYMLRLNERNKGRRAPVRLRRG